MTVKELIEELQGYSPDTPVCVGNAPIYFVEEEPAYYDGSLQYLVEDPSLKPYYSIVGMGYTDKGSKVVLHTYSVSDFLGDHTDGPVYLDQLSESHRSWYEQRVQQIRDEAIRSHQDMENGWFVNYVQKRLNSWINDDYDTEAVKEASRRWVEENLSFHLPIPDTIQDPYKSYVQKRELQWDQEIAIDFVDGKIQFRRREL